MNDLNQLRSFIKETIQNNPKHKVDILELYQLCLDNIEDGESVFNEISLCVNDVNDLIKSLER